MRRLTVDQKLILQILLGFFLLAFAFGPVILVNISTLILFPMYFALQFILNFWPIRVVLFVVFEVPILIWLVRYVIKYILDKEKLYLQSHTDIDPSEYLNQLRQSYIQRYQTLSRVIGDTLFQVERADQLPAHFEKGVHEIDVNVFELLTTTRIGQEQFPRGVLFLQKKLMPLQWTGDLRSQSFAAGFNLEKIGVESWWGSFEGKR